MVQGIDFEIEEVVKIEVFLDVVIEENVVVVIRLLRFV